jgi:hypothetical protein
VSPPRNQHKCGAAVRECPHRPRDTETRSHGEIRNGCRTTPTCGRISVPRASASPCLAAPLKSSGAASAGGRRHLEGEQSVCAIALMVDRCPDSVAQVSGCANIGRARSRSEAAVRPAVRPHRDEHFGDECGGPGTERQILLTSSTRGPARRRADGQYGAAGWSNALRKLHFEKTKPSSATSNPRNTARQRNR